MPSVAARGTRGRVLRSPVSSSSSWSRSLPEGAASVQRVLPARAGLRRDVLREGRLHLLRPAREDCGLKSASEQSWVHPPLGKLLIAAGESVFGATIEGPNETPFGWRFSSVVAGTLSVVLIAMLAWILTRSVVWTGVAGLLLATENLHFVQSRMSMLTSSWPSSWWRGSCSWPWTAGGSRGRNPSRDPEPEPDPTGSPGTERTGLASFSRTASYGPGGWPRRAGLTPDEPPSPREVPSPLWRPWRLAAGMAFGAGAAVKWSAATPLAFAVLLSLGWEMAGGGERDAPTPIREAIYQESFGIILFLTWLPCWSTWPPTRSGSANATGAWGSSPPPRGHARLPLDLEAFKENGDPTHPYQSRAWTWLIESPAGLLLLQGR